MDSEGQIAPTRVSLTSSRLQALLIGQLLRNVRYCDASESKTRHLEKFKINISTRRTQMKFCTRKRLNTKSIYAYSRSAYYEKFKRYSRSCGYEI